MGYGQAGTTPSSGTTTECTGGYFELLKESETDFDGSDFYKDINTHLLPAKINRKYYKYEYQDWVQPVLTANNSSVSMMVSATNEGQGGAWQAFDGNETTYCCSTNNVTTNDLIVKFTNTMAIDSITVKGLNNQYGSTSTITIYSDVNKSNVVGETKTFNYSDSDTLTWSFDEPIEVDTLVFEGTGITWVGILEIQINAQQKIITKATESDYDFYEQDIKYYTIV